MTLGPLVNFYADTDVATVEIFDPRIQVGLLPGTGGGGGLLPLALAALFTGVALVVINRRRRATT